MAIDSQRPRAEISLPRLLGLSVTIRLLVDTAAQIFNPFLPIFAAGLGIDVITMGQLLSLRSAAGFVAPLLGALADRYGYRRMMRLALLCAVIGLLLIGFSRNLLTAIVGMAVSGFGLSGFVPTLHAYLSARLPYHVRARGLGILEYSWALAGIVGLFAMGYLIAATNWRVPLFVLAGGLALMWLLIGILPPAHTEMSTAERQQTMPALSLGQRLRSFFDLGDNARSAYSTIIAQTLLFFAGMQLIVVHGAWLSQDYGLGAAALGTVALVLGCFDLLASVSVSLFTDRLGKRRSVMLGTGGVLLGHLCLPFLNFSLLSAVVGIALTRSAFEFGIVSHISLISEQVPNQRGKMMALAGAFVLAGGTVANLTGPWLYEQFGVTGLSGSAVIAMVIALSILFAFVREGESRA